MEYFNTDALTGRGWMLFGVVLLLSYLYYEHYRRRWMALLLLIAGLGGVAYQQGIVTDASLQNVKSFVMQSAKGASDRAKAIGAQRYQTTEGAAGKTNKAYRKHVDEEAIE